MKYFSYIFLLLLLASCTGNSTKNDTDSDSVRVLILDSIDIPDVYDLVATVGEGTSMNMLELITPSGDTIYVESPNGMVVGGVGTGDKICVTYNVQDGQNHVMTCINMTALQHLWAQPAIDGHKQCLELNEGGRAATYDMALEYDAWTLKDGRLILHSPAKIGSEQAAQADTFEIMQLDDENLVIMHGNMESAFIREN